MRLHHHQRTAGFTLIELLVVVSIIAVLVAISAGAFFRVRASQQEKLTGEKIIQLQKSFLQQWIASLDDAKQAPIPPIVLAYAQNEPDRAKALWAYIHLRRDFPESIAEARGLPPAPLPATYPHGVYLGGTLVLPRNEKIWNMVQGFTPSSPTEAANEEAAVCAYAFLTAVNRRGMESGINDSMTSKVGNFTVFVDAFQKPITFRRLHNTDEMQAKPYVAMPPGGDPLDPSNKLINADYPADLRVAIGGGRMIPHPSNAALVRFPVIQINPTTFKGRNFIPTFISSGLNKKFDVDAAGQPNGDDLYGYRLNVEGRTGN